MPIFASFSTRYCRLLIFTLLLLCSAFLSRWQHQVSRRVKLLSDSYWCVLDSFRVRCFPMSYFFVDPDSLRNWTLICLSSAVLALHVLLSLFHVVLKNLWLLSGWFGLEQLFMLSASEPSTLWSLVSFAYSSVLRNTCMFKLMEVLIFDNLCLQIRIWGWLDR